MTSELEVWLGTSLAGHLVETTQSGWSFVYQDDAADDKPPVSLALPRSRQTHHGDPVHAVFANLLPDGSLRARAARSLGLSENNDFGLLARLAGECAGAVSLHAPGTAPAAHAGAGSQGRQLDGEELRNLVAVLPVHPLMADVEGWRKTLAGEFDKLPVRVRDGRVELVLDDALTSHIIKPARPGLRESVFNEAFCMTLAAAWGLPTAPTEIIAGPVNLLAVTRLDRDQEGADVVVTRHMEDFCQALGYPPMRKYEREGGPRLQEIAGLLRRTSTQPALDIRALTGWLILGVLLGFGAGHAKQLALLHDTDGPRLAPFFGLWSTHVYAEMNYRMAFAVGLEDRPDWIGVERWRELGQILGVRPRYVVERVAAAARNLPALAGSVAADFASRHGHTDIVHRIVALITQRCRQQLVSLEVASATPVASRRRSGSPALAAGAPDER